MLLSSAACSSGDPDVVDCAGDLGPPRLAFQSISLPGDPSRITDLAFLPGGSSEFVVLQQTGKVFHYRLDGTSADLLGTFEIAPFESAGCGLLSVTFDPGFAQNGFLYLGYCSTVSSNRISRFHFTPNDYDAIAATEKVVITVEDPTSTEGWHNVGSMDFEEDGTLWVVFGEKTIMENAQDLSKNLGKLLRIVPDQDGEGYTAAKGNPFVGEEGKSPDIYAYGLRSPWTAWRDKQGRYWVADVGNNAFEEINIVSVPGQNFGWPMHEGPCDTACDGYVDPVASWDHGTDNEYTAQDPDTSTNVRRSSWVGMIYDDAKTDQYCNQLDGMMLFGDFFTGWVRGMRIDEKLQKTDDVFLAHLEAVTGWAQGPDGYLYVVTLDGKKLQRAVLDRGT
jgi:glucose/arabinose dehydrogenase